MDGIAGLGALAGPGGTVEPGKIKDAAREFEGLLITQMLRSARESMENSGGDASALLDMGEQQIGKLLAAQGGLGLASLVCQGLEVKAAK